MKKLLLSAVVFATLGLNSCGGPSLCDCINPKKDVDQEACKKIKNEFEEKMKNADKEEAKELLDEFLECGHK